MNMNDLMLIGLVRTNPILYDGKHSDYKDKMKKLKVWIEISKTMKYPVQECQSRWKYLREKYGREKRASMPDADAGGIAAAERPKWEHYDEISFLDAHVKTRRPRSSVLKSYVEYPEDSSDRVMEDVDFPDELEFEAEASEEINFKPLSNRVKREETIIIAPSEPAEMRTCPSHWREMESEPEMADNTTMASSLKELRNSMMILTKKLEKPIKDEDDLFGELIASTLKKYKEGRLKRELKKKIFNELLNYPDEE